MPASRVVLPGHDDPSLVGEYGSLDLVSRLLPRWLAWIGLLVGLTALANGTMLGSEAAWGFLAGIIWMFTSAIVLALRGTNTVAAPQLATTAS